MKNKKSEIIELYTKGLSCEKIAIIFAVSRQAIWSHLNRHSNILRPKKRLDFIIVDGVKYTQRLNRKYRATTGARQCISREVYK